MHGILGFAGFFGLVSLAFGERGARLVAQIILVGGATFCAVVFLQALLR